MPRIRDSAVVRFRHLADPRLTLVCLGFCGGGAGQYHQWAAHLASGVELAAICYPGREGRFGEGLAPDWNALAGDATGAVSRAAEAGPYVLFGHSMGAWMAFEITAHLERRGARPPERLVVSSANAPSRGLTERDRFPRQEESDERLLDWMDTHGLMPAHARSDPDLRDIALKLMRADLRVRDTFAFPPGARVDVPLQLLTGRRDAIITPDAAAQWSALTSAAFHHEVLDGGHFYTPDVWAALPRFMSHPDLTSAAPATAAPAAPPSAASAAPVTTAPAAPVTTAPRADGEALPSSDPTEAALARIWAEVVGVASVGVDDNFFEVGGNSLLAARVVSRLRAELGVDVPVRALFEHATVARLAPLLPRAGTVDGPALVSVPREPHGMPLSFAQQRMWFLDQLSPGSLEYVLPFRTHVRGPLDASALGTALAGLARRHEVLRTRFVTDDRGFPVQMIDPEAGGCLTVVDLSGTSDERERLAEAHRIMDVEMHTPFALASAHPLRAKLIRLTDAEHFLTIALHHIASDGWSMGVFAAELRELYAAALAGRGPELPELPVQYADVAVWQRRWPAGEQRRRQLGYWRRRLAGLRPPKLPTDRPYPAERTGRGETIEVTAPASLTARLDTLARSAGSTRFMAGLAVFQGLQAAWTDAPDVACGTPVAGRSRAEIEGLIGFFVNTLVLRTDLSGDPPFTEILRRTRETCLGAYQHQDLPFERLVTELSPERDLSRTPLIQTMFTLRGASDAGLDEKLSLPGVDVTPVPTLPRTAQFDVSLTVDMRDTGTVIRVTYSTDLFEQSTMRRLAGAFPALVAAAAAGPERRLSELMATSPIRTRARV